MKEENPDMLDNIATKNVCWKEEVIDHQDSLNMTRMIFTTKYHDMIVIIAISTRVVKTKRLLSEKRLKG